MELWGTLMQVVKSLYMYCVTYPDTSGGVYIVGEYVGDAMMVPPEGMKGHDSGVSR